MSTGDPRVTESPPSVKEQNVLSGIPKERKRPHLALTRLQGPRIGFPGLLRSLRHTLGHMGQSARAFRLKSLRPEVGPVWGCFWNIALLRG